MQALLIEAAGWLGAALILGSYVLVSTGRLDGRSRTFQWMNVVGAAGFVINSGWHGAIPSTALNAMWLAVGLATLWSVRRRRAGT
jgi:MYXO-CTERM domain-containing protein